ncbi:MAG: ATP-dependent helicase [Bacteroidetes bacterium]|nr:MAG: ATP-dependent helicase [Bacteroidota bacterium]
MSKIIAVIRNYKNLGFIITPFFYERKNKHFIEVAEIVTPEVAEKSGSLSDAELSIIKSVDAYSDRNLTKIFGKRQKTNDFFKTLSKDDIEKRIRPFIEKQLVIVIDKIKKAGLSFYLKRDKFTTLYPEDALEIKIEPAKTVFNIEKTENGTKYHLSIKHNGNIVNLFGKSGMVLTNEPCRLISENNLYFFDDIDGKKLLPFFNKEQLLIPSSSEKKWFEVFALKAMKKYHVNPSGFSITEKIENFITKVSVEKDWKGEYAFLLFFKYENREFQYGLPKEPKLVFNENDFSFVKILRNEEKENAFAEKLKTAGLKEHNNGAFKIPFSGKNIRKQRHETILWLKEKKSFFEENDIEIEQNFFQKEYFTEKISLNLNSKTGKDWFDIYGTVTFGKFEIPFIQLKNNILSNNSEFILPDKSIAIIPEEWFEKYGDLFLLGEEKEDGIKIGKTHFGILEKSEIKGIDNSYKENFKKLLNYNDYSAEIPENIKAKLRPYQKDGFKRMRFLRDADFGACLADDMGLGKTLQMITLLQDTINERKKDKKNYSGKPENQIQLDLFASAEDTEKYIKKSSLIVMPVSLIHNWFNEIKRFAPDLKVLKYVGNKRQNYIRKFDNYDIVLSSYATVRNDIDLIKEHEFLYVVLDESQFIKNAASKTYHAVLELDAEHKAVLTGTPVENSLSDLWSQMNFINDGILGNFSFFKNTFLIPIEKQKDEFWEQKLKTLISPFIIRRTKDEVAKDLPELTEQIVYCIQDEEQKEIYETEKSRIRNALLELKETGNSKNISADVLAALMKLRQISNHPVLVEENYEGESGKFNEVIRNIENVLSGNHKVLIFSSFVKHLNIFSEYFEQNDILYSMLTGQTKNREKVVSEFQDNKENKVFLISIKAGGTGLNLTEADYVFILDPWWNPAVEKQAVNRAHRIGQKRNVMVYKYITENTVEEKILKLQNEKSELANLIVNTENPLGKLSEEMLLSLFE